MRLRLFWHPSNHAWECNMTTRFSMLNDQSGFNTETLAIARTFTLTSEQAASINASAYSACELQQAMQSHIWNATFERVRAKLGCVLMPRWIENGICHAWDEHGTEFMEIARAEITQALNAKVTA